MTKLYPFQRDGCRQIYRFGGRAILCDEQGLGKTLQTLFWILKLTRRRPAVIVTPASVKYGWQAEALLHFDLRAEVLEGKCPRKGMLLQGDIFIVNYDILFSWLKSLRRLRPQIVIFDECQYIKNLQARRTKAALKLASKAASVLGLSGTPLTNRPEELWPILSAVRPDIFPERLKYLWRYCGPHKTRWGWKFDGAENLGELNRILKRECMIRRLKKEVMPELPDKTHKMIPMMLSKSEYREYFKAKNDFLNWLGRQSPSKAKRAKKSQALVKIGYLLRLVAKLKLRHVIEWLEEYQIAHPGRKLVCMTMHTEVIDRLRARFPDSVVVDGRVTGLKRFQAVRKFQNNKRVTFLFGNWKAAGVGLTLTAAHVLASLDFPWTPGDLLQGQDRVHRIGQKKKVLIYYLFAINTIEEKQMRTLQKKTAVLNAVLDGRGRTVEMDMFETLLKELQHEPKK